MFLPRRYINIKNTYLTSFMIGSYGISIYLGIGVWNCKIVFSDSSISNDGSKTWMRISIQTYLKTFTLLDNKQNVFTNI